MCKGNNRQWVCGFDITQGTSATLCEESTFGLLESLVELDINPSNIIAKLFSNFDNWKSLTDRANITQAAQGELQHSGVGEKLPFCKAIHNELLWQLNWAKGQLVPSDNLPLLQETEPDKWTWHRHVVGSPYNLREIAKHNGFFGESEDGEEIPATQPAVPFEDTPSGENQSTPLAEAYRTTEMDEVFGGGPILPSPFPEPSRPSRAGSPEWRWPSESGSVAHSQFSNPAQRLEWNYYGDSNRGNAAPAANAPDRRFGLGLSDYPTSRFTPPPTPINEMPTGNVPRWSTYSYAAPNTGLGTAGPSRPTRANLSYPNLPPCSPHATPTRKASGKSPYSCAATNIGLETAGPSRPTTAGAFYQEPPPFFSPSTHTSTNPGANSGSANGAGHSGDGLGADALVRVYSSAAALAREQARNPSAETEEKLSAMLEGAEPIRGGLRKELWDWD